MRADIRILTSFSESSEQLGVGEWVGSYRLERKIGEGSFGLVHFASSKKRQCAVKQVKSMVYLEKCRNEHNILKEINDQRLPFVVKYFGHHVLFNHMCLVTKYAPGGDLKQIMDKKCEVFQEREMKFYTTELMVAIKKLHKYGILHLDIIPSNVLVDKRGHVALTDFGSAVKGETLQELQLKSQCCLDESADWWCLGVLWLELVGGKEVPESPGVPRGLQKGSIEIPRPFDVLGNCSHEAQQFVNDVVGGNYSILNNKSSLKHHTYMKDVDWKKVKHSKYEVPFVPQS